MSSRKKLTLGPLPEQREDYSQYEESEIRWDRIVIAGIALILVLIALISLFIDGSDSDRDLSGAALSEEPVVTLDASNQPPDAQTVEPSEPEKQTDISEEFQGEAVDNENATVDKVSVADDKAAAENVTAKNTAVENIDIKPVAKVQNEPEKPSEPKTAEPKTAEPKTAEPKTAEPKTAETKADEPEEPAQQKISMTPEPQNLAKLKPASILITNSAIKEAVLNLSTDKGLPGAVVEQSVTMPSSGLIKVMLTTEMHGLTGKRLYHEWYRNGERQARVTIPVNIAKQRSHSSKFIDKHMLGDWQVKVIDSAGEPFVMADFEVIRTE